MKELENNRSQFVIATHSPILLAYPNAEIYEVTDNGLSRIDYENTEQYRLTKYFLANYSQVVRELMD